MQNLPQIAIYNSKVQPGDLTKGVQEMKRLLAEAEQPKYAYIPKIAVQNGTNTTKKKTIQKCNKSIFK